MHRPWQRVAILRRGVAWAFGWVSAGALYLLLIDTTSLPELIVGAVAAALAATGFELAREQRILGATLLGRSLTRLHRPLLNVPRDIAWVSLVAIRQLIRRGAVCGEFRSVGFRCGTDRKQDTGRRALAESVGSFAPNTIVIGVDEEREQLLAHQLRPAGGRDAVDVLELG